MAGGHIQSGGKRVREVSLHFGGHKVLILRDCLYVPNIRRNLIYVFCLACTRFPALFNNNFFLLNMEWMRYVMEC